MMDNLRRNNVDEQQQQQQLKYLPEHDKQQQEQYKLISNSGHDGVTYEGPFNNEEVGKGEDFRKGLNKLDTVTTVPQLQQKFNKFNIIDEAAINTNLTTTSSKTCVAAAKPIITTTTSTSSSSSLKHKTLTQQQQNTALAKFNRIIDNTVPVTNTYNYQQHVAETLAKNSQHKHPHYQQQQQQQHQELQEMPILSDSLKRRLATNHHHQYYSNINNINTTDLIVNNSKINFPSSTAAAATVTTSSAAASAKAVETTFSKRSTAMEASTSKAALAAAGLTMLSSASATSSQQEQEPETATTTQKIIGRKSLVEEDEQLERNDVHYLLKQLNSFSDIEEIEIVDMKQKQRQLQEQQQQEQQQQYIKEKHFVKADNQQQQQQQQHLEMHYQAAKSDEQHDEDILEAATINYLEYQQVAEQKQHVSSSNELLTEIHVAESLEQQQQQKHVVDVGLPMYTSESKQHYHHHHHPATSPTATSLVIYSPSSQSHKGIRRYASQDEQNAAASYHQLQQQHPHHQQYHPLQQHPYPPHHHHYLHHQPHYVHLPQEHCSEDSILNSMAAQAAAASADPLVLQQFMDDYIFQSCHYLETNNFVANYRTAMVESSSHEFRPSTTTTNTTRTSNEEFYEEEEAGYVEDHSSAHSFELHETEPPSVICKAPAPLAASKRQQHYQEEVEQQEQQHFTMETRLCSSGVQTDLTASSLAQSFSLSSSLSSSEKHKRRQPLFKCCYTPLDRWREKRSQQSQIQKRTKSATTTTVKFADKTIEHYAPQEHQSQHIQQITTKNTKVAIVGGPSSTVCTTTIVNSCIATSTNATVTTATAATTLVVQPQSHTQHHTQHHPHHSQTLSKNNNNKNNAPYAV